MRRRDAGCFGFQPMLFGPKSSIMQAVKGPASPRVSKNKKDLKPSASPLSSKSVSNRLAKKRPASSAAINIKNPTRNQKEAKKQKPSSSRKWNENFILMIELRKKILIFRDIIDLHPLDGTRSVTEIVTLTLTDLQKLCPEIIQRKFSEMKRDNMDKILVYFHQALKSIGDSWISDPKWMDKCKHKNSSVWETASDKLVENVLATLDGLIKMTKERFDAMELDEEEEETKKEVESPKMSKTYSGRSMLLSPSGSFSESGGSICGSPITPKSVLPEIMTGKVADFGNSSSPGLWNLRVQALEKLSPIDVKRLAVHLLSQIGSKDEDGREKSQRFPLEQETCFPVMPVTSISETPSMVVEPPPLPPSATPETTLGANVGHPPPNPPSIVPQSHLEAPLPQPPSPTMSRSSSRSQSSPPPPQSLTAAVESTPPPPQRVAPRGLAASPSPPPPTLKTMTASPPQPPLPGVVSASPVLQQLPPASMAPPPPSFPRANTVSLPQTPGTARRSPPPPPPLPGEAAAPPLPPPLPPPPPGTVRTSPPPPPPPPGAAAAPPSHPPGSSVGVPPPPPILRAEGAVGPPPPPMPLAKGAAAPPPPPGGTRNLLQPRKANTKLKRSTHIGNLYRILKSKVEGRGPEGRSGGGGRKGAVGNARPSGNQGMAEALAEMTKRSAYFQQIEEDVQKYAKPINELKPEIGKFQTKDMEELLRFHKKVESVLETLTDETQVLARFEGFPEKKLEALRMAAALYLKLQTIVTDLRNWKIEPPVNQLLDKVEGYFTKIKSEVDRLDRTKDEEAKKFQSHNIHFDFNILVRIKESMVDVSSSCMELALKEKRDAKREEGSDGKKTQKTTVCAKLLWKAFQLAFKVYTFAGGHDDRADNLTIELAQEIQTEPQNHS